ncbi:MAG TPA: hypothetical protein PLA43_00990 [Bryobacteraceae bacterium]|nr:hypothetical protein [Bryobacteraceae bacterium]HOL72523.1 hypothetical protein [Bryobacteraceae bacterium]HOQ44185.1 hypothetical protein [Bryobacteraceae bacterium]HPQ14674.1 hypothetical protein [Bryobacteraceae bacterium]HPU70503.1 hypothetical protein [Bryobacteraceae bacterium]
MEAIVSNALTFYTLLAVSLGLCLYLFVTLKREIQAGRRKQAALEAELSRVHSGIGEVSSKLAETEERTLQLVAPPPPRAGMNIGTRSQALRMWRRGHTPQQIAAALGIPEKEVELLVKVQRIVMEATTGPLTDSGPAKTQPKGWETPRTDSPRAPLEAPGSAPARA